MKTSSSLSLLNWIVKDDGFQSGEANMAADRYALESMNQDSGDEPILRFFEWESPCISYGYLLDEKRVQLWGKLFGNIPMVKRPTGGGAVYHRLSDLSVSLLWQRAQGIFPEKPDEAYKAIHEIFKQSLKDLQPGNHITLYVNKAARCQSLKNGQMIQDKFSICFDEPICNDVMMNGEKIVGGALRITRRAILYQGNIQMAKAFDKTNLKKIIYRKLIPSTFPSFL